MNTTEEICHECQIIGRPNCSEHGVDAKPDRWIYFSTRHPTEKDLPIICYSSGRIVYELHDDKVNNLGKWSDEHIAWLHIGPLPKPVDEGEKAWIETTNRRIKEDMDDRDYFLAGYAAGLKKGKL